MGRGLKRQPISHVYLLRNKCMKRKNGNKAIFAYVLKAFVFHQTWRRNGEKLQNYALVLKLGGKQ